MHVPFDNAILIRDIEFEANHGWTKEEQRSTRRFRVSLSVAADLTQAAQSDKLSETVDYQALCGIVVRIGTGSTHRLLETIAGKIIEEIKVHYPGAKVALELEKLSPACPGVPSSCAVRMTA